MKSQLKIKFKEIISPENLLAAWQEFVCGKRGKKDVQEFGLNLADNILQLNEELANFSYKHGEYVAFNISDPKPRNIHKAKVRDRVLHHAIYRLIYSFFDKTFTADSYSCRMGKGMHKAVQRFEAFGLKESKNYTKTVWVLKCDIRKFFASIDHQKLLNILQVYIPDQNIVWLLREIIQSFSTEPDKGLPLGNLTSQIFCNIYMNEFDQFVKHKLKVKFYIRYADDFVFLSQDREYLENLLPLLADFLDNKLKLTLHPNKISLKTLASGLDFLGWVHFPHHRVLRNVTKRRMFRGITKRPNNQALQSYLGLMGHGDTFGLKQDVLNLYGLLSEAN